MEGGMEGGRREEEMMEREEKSNLTPSNFVCVCMLVCEMSGKSSNINGKYAHIITPSQHIVYLYVGKRGGYDTFAYTPNTSI